MTSFFGFSIASNGLSAQQRALETISHNIANASTEGYSRQSTQISATDPVKVASGRAGMLGTGAHATQISRQRNNFLDLQYRNQNTLLSESQTNQNMLSQIEGVFGEPSDNGLRMTMERFWTSWQDLSTNPESAAARGSVRESALAMTNSLNSAYDNLQQLREDLNLQVKNSVTDINILGKQIAGLNEQIRNITIMGQSPNDLQDQRDLALDKLSGIVGTKYFEKEDGTVTVTIGGRVLVETDGARSFGTEIEGAEGFVNVITASGSEMMPAELEGKLKSLLELRDKVLSPTVSGGIIQKINEMANGLAEAVNTMHKSGYDLNGDPGEDFFASSDGATINAKNITISNILQNGNSGLNKIAAAKELPVATGDNRNVMDILSIKSSSILNGGTTTVDDYYKEIITTIGIQGQAANRMTNNQKNLLSFVSGERESNSGVNLDEEMADLIRFQHAYNASARVLSIMDNLLESLIKGS